MTLVDNAEMWERWDRRLRMKEYIERDTVTLQTLAIMSNYHPSTDPNESDSTQPDYKNRHERRKDKRTREG